MNITLCIPLIKIFLFVANRQLKSIHCWLYRYRRSKVSCQIWEKKVLLQNEWSWAISKLKLCFVYLFSATRHFIKSTERAMLLSTGFSFQSTNSIAHTEKKRRSDFQEQK